MTWARLDDGYFTHRKVVDLSKDAKLLDLAAIAYCARELTDGELTASQILTIAIEAGVTQPFVYVDELISAMRWESDGSRYVVCDYLQYNPSREQIEQTTATRHAGRHLRRARERNAVGRFTASEWRALCRAFGDRCLACGQRVPLTADHVVPLALGGSNAIDNIQPLCFLDNMRKGTHTTDYRPKDSA